MRIRLVAYAALASVLGSLSLVMVVTRPAVAVDVVRRGSEPYTHVGRDSIRNTFNVHVRNKDVRRRTFALEFSEPLPGRHNWENRRFAVGAGQLQTLQLDVTVPVSDFHFGKREIALRLSDDGLKREFFTTLVGPFGNAFPKP